MRQASHRIIRSNLDSLGGRASKSSATVCTCMNETGYPCVTDLWMKRDHYLALHFFNRKPNMMPAENLVCNAPQR